MGSEMCIRDSANPVEPRASVARARRAGAPADAWACETAFGNGREPARLAAATAALRDAVAAGSAYRTAANARALPFDFVARASGAAVASSLAHHAEKKALAALVARGRGEELCVGINLKMCADCHAFFKGASRVLGRQIRVQEPKMLHVFERGECSCADGWRWEERARAAR